MSAKLFDAETVRKIRLSPLSGTQLAAQYRSSVGGIEKLRAGRRYGPLQPDEENAQRQRRNKRLPVFAEPMTFDDYRLRVGPLFGGGMLTDQDRQEAMDAAHECEHGCLAHDDRCDCWVAA